MNKKLIIIVIPIIIVAVAAVLYFMVFSKDSEPVAEYDMYSPGDYFVTNVSDNPNRLIKATIIIELDSKNMQDTLASKNVLIRDTIIFILRKMSTDDVMSEQGAEKLRQDLVKALNEKLETDHIIGILFNDFVLA